MFIQCKIHVDFFGDRVRLFTVVSVRGIRQTSLFAQTLRLIRAPLLAMQRQLHVNLYYQSYN